MVDIIIRAKNGHELTHAAIRSIRENTSHPYRIIFCDDGSDPAYPADDLDFVIRGRDSRGAVSATNAGLALSLQLDGDYVAVLDNDVRVPAGDRAWLDRFISELEADPKTACVGATTNFANPPQHILTVPQTYAGNWEKGEKDNPPVRWFVSFCCLMRKEAVRQVGLWDERYNPGNWEDTDYAMQLRKAGWLVRVARSVYLHHEGHKTFGADLAKLMNENKEKFLRKWGVGGAWDMGMLQDNELAALLRAKAKGQA